MNIVRRSGARARCLVILAVLVACTATAAPAIATPAKVGPPSRITALGDSITRGFNSQGSGCTAFADCPANSWATGTNAAVNSYFTRVKALNPAAVLSVPITSSTAGGNNAVTGAKVAGLAGATGQAQNAVASNPDMVLIEIGANDVCASSEAAMTSETAFRASFTDAMNRLSQGAPNARIEVLSIPNIYNLWDVLKGNILARTVWGVASICQSMLANPTSTSAADVTRRNNVRARNQAFNGILQDVCSQYIHCRYDGGAAYGISFLASDVSTNDYFHPNTNGQAKAAAAAWNAGPSYTDLTAPTTTISRDRTADGVDDWYRGNVTVSISATDPNSAVAGSEFFYKLVGEVDKPWTKYTGPFSISAEGSTEVVARSVDVNGNIEASKSDIIKIDKTAPSFDLACTSPLLLGGTGQQTVSNAADALSGFATSPNGSDPFTADQPGHGQTSEVEIQDRAGNTATRTCTFDVDYPTPGAPALTAGASPNADGLFTLGWTGADPASFGIRYALQHRDADDADFSDVAGGIAALDHAFNGAGEGEGTWTYRVQGSDDALGLTTPWSAVSAEVKVDRSAPNAPTVSADRAPDYAGGGGWYRDSVTASFADNGDPALQDGSAGTGVDAGSVPAAVTESTSGPHAISGSVADNVGNTSLAGSLTVQVDATNPTISFTSCPAAVLLHTTASNVFSSADAHSGLASAAAGTTSIDTSTVGPKTTNRTATDNVGRTADASCTTQVQYQYGGLQQPVNTDGSSIFKLNSAVPLKFKLTDYAGAPLSGAVARLSVAKVTNAIEGIYLEAEAKGNSSSGNVFSQDGDGQYHYNLDTKPLSTGTWSAKITLDDGTSYTTRFSLK